MMLKILIFIQFLRSLRYYFIIHKPSFEISHYSLLIRFHGKTEIKRLKLLTRNEVLITILYLSCKLQFSKVIFEYIFFQVYKSIVEYKLTLN